MHLTAVDQVRVDAPPFGLVAKGQQAPLPLDQQALQPPLLMGRYALGKD